MCSTDGGSVPSLRRRILTSQESGSCFQFSQFSFQINNFRAFLFGIFSHLFFSFPFDSSKDTFSLIFCEKFWRKKNRKERNPAYIYIFAAQKINVRKMGISRSVCLYLHLFLILSSCCCCYFCFCCCFCCCYISEMFVFPSQVI